MEEKHDEPREERMEGHFHNKPSCENDESEEGGDDIPDIKLFEPSVNKKGEENEVDEDDDEDCPEEDSDDVPDTEKFGQSFETTADEKTEPAQRKCTECEFTAPTKGKLNEHYTEGHGGRKYKCNKHQKSNHDSNATKKVKRIGCLKCEEDIEHFSCIAKNEAELGSIDRKLKLQNLERALFSCCLLYTSDAADE